MEKPRLILRLQESGGRRGHYHGRRPSRLPRRDTGTLPYDCDRRIRFGVGIQAKRYDPLSKTLPTKLFNATARKVSGIKNLHDFNCGLKAYRKEVVKSIEVYGEMHRYIPYLAKNAGFDKIGEKVVHHQARKYGKTKFGGLNRFFNGYLDLISLWFLSKFGVKPMHIFGFLGSIMFILGFIAAGVIGVNKLYDMYCGNSYRLITDSPYFISP